MRPLATLLIVSVWTLNACTTLNREPVQIDVADIESLPGGEDLESRMLVKLRVKNPNNSPIEFNGVYFKLEVMGKSVATGISDQAGSVPRYGEALVEVPVTISAVTVATHAVGIALKGKAPEKITYNLNGKLAGPMFGSVNFQSNGELDLTKR